MLISTIHADIKLFTYSKKKNHIKIKINFKKNLTDTYKILLPYKQINLGFFIFYIFKKKKYVKAICFVVVLKRKEKKETQISLYNYLSSKKQIE